MSRVQSALHMAHLVFVGDVEHVELRRDPLRQRVKFRAAQRFKGTVEAGQTLEFGYSGENFEFKTGQRVLVYAVNERGVMSTACTRTRVVAAADKEVAELQTLISRANSVVRFARGLAFSRYVTGRFGAKHEVNDRACLWT